ncbi:Geranylgeranyl pyrophosphate synthetase [Operophtera brumata]|uniref:Geranylgeranyl pyrophosphate synthetase n=1 Tax=Operophtera brumata TaxID=104452 RepID=A0A0L7KSP6_OPEBR|nr:Geranylgeranyl pyrophosphate synthetase [Operophtera brumata]
MSPTTLGDVVKLDPPPKQEQFYKNAASATGNARKRFHSPEPFQAAVTKGLETFMDQQNRLLEQLVALSRHQTDLLTHKADHLRSDSLDGQEVEEPAELQAAEPIEDHFFDRC